jgi:hypothetical protein
MTLAELFVLNKRQEAVKLGRVDVETVGDRAVIIRVEEDDLKEVLRLVGIARSELGYVGFRKGVRCWEIIGDNRRATGKNEISVEPMSQKVNVVKKEK